MVPRLSDGGDAHDQWVKEQNAPRREPPLAIEIMHMERALAWPGAYLRHKPDLGRAFNVVALATSREVSVEDVVRRGKHCGVLAPAIWHEMAQEGADRIARGLRGDPVMVF